MSATIKDVAEKAGVSVATVSRVLNEAGIVTPKTRKVVEQVIRELQYTPNRLAISLKMNRTATIGVLLPDMYGEFFSELIRGMDLAASDEQYHVLLSSAHGTVSDFKAALTAMTGRVDGLLLMAPSLSWKDIASCLTTKIPIVLINTEAPENVYTSIQMDNHGGAYKMTKHLVANGHRRIAILTGKEINKDSRERLAGYRQAIGEGGLTPVERDGNFNVTGGQAAMTELLTQLETPFAVFCSNDAMAIGAMRAVRDAGLQVPKDVAIAGFDDVSVAEYISPALSSVRVSIEELGRLAVQKLLAQLKTEQNLPPERIAFPTELSIRESCGGI